MHEILSKIPIRTFLNAWVPIYISGSLFSVFWLNQREECQFSLHIQNNEAQLFCSLQPSLLLEMVSIFVGNGSVLHCWQILIFTPASALNFIGLFISGSLFWLLRVPI